MIYDGCFVWWATNINFNYLFSHERKKIALWLKVVKSGKESCTSSSSRTQEHPSTMIQTKCHWHLMSFHSRNFFFNIKYVFTLELYSYLIFHYLCRIISTSLILRRIYQLHLHSWQRYLPYVPFNKKKIKFILVLKF